MKLLITSIRCKLIIFPSGLAVFKNEKWIKLTYMYFNKIHERVFLIIIYYINMFILYTNKEGIINLKLI